MPLIVAPELAVIITLDRDPAQAAGARRKVRELVTGWSLGQHADLAELVVSELVANALRHGAGPIEIRLFRGPGGLRVEVHDDGAGRPVRRHAGDYDECGRGLELLDGLIAPLGGAWGTVEDRHAPGEGLGQDHAVRLRAGGEHEQVRCGVGAVEPRPATGPDRAGRRRASGPAEIAAASRAACGPALAT